MGALCFIKKRGFKDESPFVASFESRFQSVCF